ncbi:MAG TPA: response regulator transcription factor [Solirubrobacteraceae bacterium]|jgi:DNA-binding response OmpR family regulator
MRDNVLAIPVLAGLEPGLATRQSAAMHGGVHRWSAAESPGSVSSSAGPILLVEADARRASILGEQLASEGYRVELARSTEHARALAVWSQPRMILIGSLARAHGALALLREIRRPDAGRPLWSPTVPVIVIGAGASQLDTLRAFEAGADDFLSSHERYLELRARIRALLHRIESAPEVANRLTVGGLEIDTRGHLVRVEGEPVRLRRLEFELLVELAAEPERVFTKQQLLRAVWGYRSCGSTRTVDSHASRLRRKLERFGGRWVINEWGVGYRLR